MTLLKSILFHRHLFALFICIFLASCAGLESGIAKVNAFSTSPTGSTILNAVQLAAAAFEPKYAGVIGIGINSLQTGAIPTPAQAQIAIAAVTGKSVTDNKVINLALAVLTAAKAAPSPAVGLQAAANVVSPPSPSVTVAQAKAANAARFQNATLEANRTNRAWRRIMESRREAMIAEVDREEAPQ